ncbi:alpha/beta hydrolase [Gordonia sp. CPCC 205515]|uniref:alpha/beta hydrolase n=1 Tax=Gordonia sp. CPCC 205515 TaxID=3140791 RepID=UPI003AF35E58
MTVAAAAPQDARIVSVTQETPTRASVWTYSPSMHKQIKVYVLTPRHRTPSSVPPNRPTLYLLDGAGAKGNVSDWLRVGGAEQYFADQDATVVLPVGAYGTFYADWERADPRVGKPMWETFLTRELPPLIDARFGGGDRNAIAGVSMGGQAAYSLAARHPSLYRAVASLSSCPRTSTPAGEAFVRATIARGGADADNMWGPPGSPGWRAHDPGLRLDALRGKRLYLYAGEGQLGPADTTRTVTPEEGAYQVVLATSAALEVAAYDCSQQFATQIRNQRLPFVDGFTAVGTHHWYYWARQLPHMWEAMSPGL